MKIFMTGGTGFVGATLSAALAAKGWSVTLLTRASGDRRAPPGAAFLEGNPMQRGPWQEKAAEHDVLINLAGASIFKRWSSDAKKMIRDSRVLATRNLAEVVSARRDRETLFFSTSAVGYYGFHGDEELDESSPHGSDFLADVCREWEAEAGQAGRWGARVVICRFGIVLGNRGGALGEMLPFFKRGLGSPLGGGRQWVSWIHERDLVRIFLHLMEREDVTGPVNCTSPNPVRNAELAAALAAALGKPLWMPAVPGFVLKLMKGEVGSILLKGQKALPRKLLGAGFSFAFPAVREAVEDLLAETAGDIVEP